MLDMNESPGVLRRLWHGTALSPGSLNVSFSPELQSLEQLSRKYSEVKSDLEKWESRREFHLAVWKATPYALIPVISISAIVAYYSFVLQFPWLISVPIIVFVGSVLLGRTSRRLAFSYGEQIADLKELGDKIQKEMGFREQGIIYVFNNRKVWPYWQRFYEGYYCGVNNLPWVETVQSIDELFEIRFPDFSFRFPALTEQMKGYIELETKYFVYLKKIFDKVMEVLKRDHTDKYHAMASSQKTTVVKTALKIAEMKIRSLEEIQSLVPEPFSDEEMAWATTIISEKDRGDWAEILEQAKNLSEIRERLQKCGKELECRILYNFPHVSKSPYDHSDE